MLLQYVSDLHLEFHDKKNKGSINPSMFVEPAAPYLALAGDIGNPDLRAYDTFLEYCSRNWKKVFLVAGNHEYYNCENLETKDMAAKKATIDAAVAKYPNIYFLDKSSHYLEEEHIEILGCALWSDIPPSLTMKAFLYMNDYRQIPNMHPNKTTALHHEQRSWLSWQIRRCEQEGKQCIVITHHLPSFQLIAEKYQDHPLNGCFASDCEHLLGPPILGWICGHSHTGNRKIINGVECVLNPWGYPVERVETRNRRAVLDLVRKE